MSRVCKNHPNLFCCVCGELTLNSNEILLLWFLELLINFTLADKLAIRTRIGLQEFTALLVSVVWPNGSKVPVNQCHSLFPWFGVNLCHLTDCYFCRTFTIGFSGKSKQTTQYPNIPSAIRPIPHNDSLPIPGPPKTYTLQPEIDLKDFELQPGPCYASTDDEECSDDSADGQPHLITQSELNDLVRDLELPKGTSQLLGSRLQQLNLL
jgi:hypothetical protein